MTLSVSSEIRPAQEASEDAAGAFLEWLHWGCEDGPWHPDQDTTAFAVRAACHLLDLQALAVPGAVGCQRHMDLPGRRALTRVPAGGQTC